MPVKVWWKSKTIWVNALLLIIAIISVFQANPATNWEFLAISSAVINVLLLALAIIAVFQANPTTNWEFLAIGSAVINVLLRFVTHGAIGLFEDDGL